jgi:endonuclease V-like protein UPF0215 family
MHISQVKEEFRVLGVAATRTALGFLAIGVVYRGNKELDGVLSRKDEENLSEIICDMLLESKHHGQVRLILLDENMLPEPVNTETIWMKTGKPVLKITKSRAFDPRSMLRYGDFVVSATGIDEESAKRVLNRIYGDSGSEALRISGIILESISELHNV